MRRSLVGGGSLLQILFLHLLGQPGFPVIFMLFSGAINSLVGAAGEEQTPGVPAALYVQARKSPLLADGSPPAEIRQDPDLQYPHETGASYELHTSRNITAAAAFLKRQQQQQPVQHLHDWEDLWRWKGLPTGVPQPEEESLMPKSLEITQKWTSAALRILPDVSQAATASVVEGKADLNENSFWRDPQRNTERHQSEAAVASRLSLIEEFRRFSRQHVGGGGDPWSLLSRHRGAADPIGLPQNVQALGNILERPPERVRDGSVWGIDDLRAGFQEALQQSSLLPPTRGRLQERQLERQPLQHAQQPWIHASSPVQQPQVQQQQVQHVRGQMLDQGYHPFRRLYQQQQQQNAMHATPSVFLRVTAPELVEADSTGADVVSLPPLGVVAGYCPTRVQQRDTRPEQQQWCPPMPFSGD
ncbi:hypothetical protein cyc_04092 [Cyclospora cayetanensis]|uniref:Uncharacterized protein n=1 Tax=Cyclospora cayetanensis TaxID=88456 RepID=A0A1D3CZD9_9EIME|nr:hypothetical protein cyc_04092 [Cyclospora cayetanensis]